MKTKLRFLLLMMITAAFTCGCSSNDDVEQMMEDDIITIDDDNTTDDEPTVGDFEMVDVSVMLPDASSVELSNSTMVSLGLASGLDANGNGSLPVNSGTLEIGYLLDNNNKVLLAGFISEERKELSVETTAELMVYYALGYYLLPESGKSAFLKSIGQAPEFSAFVEELRNLFTSDPLMYSEGGYETALQVFLDQITAKNVSGLENRIFFNDEKTKSGITLSSVDSTNIILQNSLPRRSRVLIYKKSYTDRNGEVFEIPNYSSSTFADFELEPGSNVIQEFKVGASLGEINSQEASIDNTVKTDPILLPVNTASEFVAEYEVVIIGSGQRNSEVRDMTAAELDRYAEINKKTYVIDYFLPTLLDISGNKSLLPPFGSEKETDLFNAVSPVLEQYPNVIAEVVQNKFKEATEIFLPALYGDIRLSDDLRGILKEVYNILSGNGDFPNTFIQDQEMIETGNQRTKLILSTIDKNIKATNYYSNFGPLRTTAFNFESWDIKSIDAVVEMQQDNVELCLGESTDLGVSIITDYDPEVEEFEFHWSTSGGFGGRVQDIDSDPSNFGQSIITKTNHVSYISTALESELGNGDNLETVTVTLVFRNKNTNELTEAGSDTMTINNKKGCESFTATFTRQPNLREIPNSSCPNDTGYQASSPIPYAADFAKVDGASGYKGIITRSNGVVNDESVLNNELLEDIGDGVLRYTTYVGSIRAYNSCNQAEAEARAEEWANNINVEPVSIEITPIFE